MTTTPHLLAIHQQLLDLSQEMRHLAAAGQWDELIQKEVDYVSRVQQLAQSTGTVPLSAQMQSTLQRILRHILDNECEVRRLLQERMNELALLVSQSSRQKSVLSTYGNSGTVLVPQDKG